MYLSKLTLDLSLPEIRRLLVNPYMLHKAIFRAFPDAGQGGTGRILYRLDTQTAVDNTCLLVQSEKEPAWNKAELLKNGTLHLESKLFNPVFSVDQVFYFRLRANPTIKKFISNRPVRLGIIKENDQLDWLKRKGLAGGFSILDYLIIPEGMLKDKKRTDSEEYAFSLISVRFEGKLKVTDTALFRQIVESGLGSAKGFGFGLLSLAPVRD